MRIGQNPAKSVDQVHQPARVTAAVVCYIPFLGGYYAQSLDVLKLCLGSLRRDPGLPLDLLVFDNASCPEVRAYLQQAQAEGEIQFLILSDHNIGKSGAWNMIFAGAPGEIIAYADSDILFFPGWLKAQVDVLEAFPQAGMVTGLPLWSPEEYSTATVQWATRAATQNAAQSNLEVRLERGQILPWEDYWRHSRSLGTDEAKARAHFASRQDIVLHVQDRRYYVGAGHFQFIARKRVLQQALPMPSDRPMGQVRALDAALNERGFLRLSTPDWWVQHMGNTLPEDAAAQTAAAPAAAKPPAGRKKTRLWKPIRRLLAWLNDRTFDLLYRS